MFLPFFPCVSEMKLKVDLGLSWWVVPRAQESAGTHGLNGLPPDAEENAFFSSFALSKYVSCGGFLNTSCQN